MYDLSSRFNTFYKNHVVLPKTEQDKLHDKKELNIQRLKDGLKEYNEENKTSYSIVETCVQGSMGMSTVVQNEDHDYDIDVAIGKCRRESFCVVRSSPMIPMSESHLHICFGLWFI